MRTLLLSNSTKIKSKTIIKSMSMKTSYSSKIKINNYREMNNNCFKIKNKIKRTKTKWMNKETKIKKKIKI